MVMERADSRTLFTIASAALEAVFVAASKQPYLSGIILEGPYSTFYNVLKMRTKIKKKPTFPICIQMALLYKKYAGVSIFSLKPIESVKEVTVPTLFLCGKEDKSNNPADFTKIYDACASQSKSFVWFDHGAHSHLRIVNPEKYDSEVTKFINS